MSNSVATSARNQFPGTIQEITASEVNTEVIIDIGDGSKLTAIITNSSAKALDLKPGSQVVALFKATWVIVSVDTALRTSARNQFKGKIVSAKPGAVNAEIIIEVPGGNLITAIVTNESFSTLALKGGLEVLALVKASHVVIGVK
ncbi:MAG: TOBE domain-containing protein [Deltaproteobacteria bacterium]|jgi:molybdate transport system regulatory protein|nr:TOBE domain-containing protein [Deltaproteobacteria bacterium]